MLFPDVPIMNSNIDLNSREKYLELFETAKAGRVWIALDRVSLFERGEHLEKLSENIKYFENNGFETGVWIGSLGFGEPMPKGITRDWTRIKSVMGVQNEVDAFCPEDPDFVLAYNDWIKDIVRAGARLIMLDDEFCLSVRPGLGCFCDRHIKLLEKKVGKITDHKCIFTGGNNKYRDAYLEVMGDSLRNFCKKIRQSVDSIDATVRVGVCAGYTSWDIEGTDTIEISRILAGNTKPFLRFTGAPYWVSPTRRRFSGQRLAAIIECARNQLSWVKDTEIEFFGEADSFPRPAYNCNAMLIENFDIAMRASGVKTLKYLYDYVSSPDYEMRYQKIHVKNLPFYEQIENSFKDTVTEGVRLYRPMHKFKNVTFPEEFIGEKNVMAKSFFSMSAAMLSYLGIPVCYDGGSRNCAVFGDDVLFYEDKHEKVLLDLPAALKLQSMGYDVGIKATNPTDSPNVELFENERVQMVYVEPQAKFYDLILDEKAVVKSRFDTGAVASFEYEKFLVLNFDALFVGEGSSLFCSYSRGKQLKEFFGNSYPSIPEYSEIYTICSKTQNGHVVLFQNQSIDPAFDFDIDLPKICKAFKLYNAEGIANSNKIHITSVFHPSDTILLEVEYN